MNFQTAVKVFDPCTDSWRSLGKRAPHWLDWRSPTALVNGIIHWLTQTHKHKQYHEIVAFDYATEVFHEVPYPSCSSFRRNMYSLVELGGRLCAVVDAYCNGKIDLWAMKEYNVALSWSKDYIVGEHIHGNKRDFARIWETTICLL
ncbi:hypothetical protein Syun_026850 [Stephania yunnanensis]|uniref:F-box associated beta-propeller type 1 domain-containing protein n=1 Tax=Stephania yunnanensis TaxID=152371 RepID=A0AAP0EET9_9MAGN